MILYRSGTLAGGTDRRPHVDVDTDMLYLRQAKQKYKNEKDHSTPPPYDSYWTKHNSENYAINILFCMVMF